MPTERNRPWGIHTIHSITQPGTQCEFMPGAWGPAVAEPYTGNRLVAAWWVLTGRAYAMIWPTSGELNAAIGTPIPKQIRRGGVQVNHTMTQLMTERETLRAEVERQDREIERLRAALQNIESEMHGLGMSRQIARDALESK